MSQRIVPTSQQVKAALLALASIAEAIREASEIPSGTLYAACMSRMDLATYESFIDRLIGAGLVRRSHHLLTWVGPVIAK